MKHHLTAGALLAPVLAGVLAISGCARQRPTVDTDMAAVLERLAATEKQLQQLQDVNAIEKLQRAYGYYVDKGLWDNVVDLFAEESTVEIEAGGVYVGKQGADRLFRQKFGSGRIGFKDGVLFNHPQFQGIVDVDPSGTTAKGRWRTLAQVAWYGSVAFWNEGVYENEYVKQDGVWKFSKMKFWSTYFTPYDKGWAQQEPPPIGWGANMPDSKLPPDRPSEPGYRMYPRYFVPPFHYSNPVSGRAFAEPERTAAGEFPADRITPEEFARKQFAGRRK
ncbi:MAG TPA: nuclear transport factor 2 family protein [Povalibacter sp.]|nr:nuclear transport factor 2 family protein [Povalibacter sp.]